MRFVFFVGFLLLLLLLLLREELFDLSVRFSTLFFFSRHWRHESVATADGSLTL